MNSVALNIEGESEVSVVSRKDIPAIHSVEIDGEKHNLGILKNYRAHPELGSFIPESAQVSMAWVRLRPNEVLQAHRHPVSSMIIITEGECELLGARSDLLAPGDVVAVPAGSLHGFVGRGTNGFWGISLQFEDQGLYEHKGAELVVFEGGESPCHTLSQLLARNDRYYARFLENPVFEILRNPSGVSSERRRHFLDLFQVWSDEFQRMMLLRSALCDDKHFADLFGEHLRDEFGHNTELAASRDDRCQRFDPTFEALCRWFPGKIATVDNVEQTVLVHLVVERSAVGFYKYAQPIFGKGGGDHFDKHNELDSIHERMGINCLRGLSASTYKRLGEIQDLGWDMLNTMFSRLAEIVSKIP